MREKSVGDPFGDKQSLLHLGAAHVISVDDTKVALEWSMLLPNLHETWVVFTNFTPYIRNTVPPPIAPRPNKRKIKKNKKKIRIRNISEMEKKKKFQNDNLLGAILVILGFS